MLLLKSFLTVLMWFAGLLLLTFICLGVPYLLIKYVVDWAAPIYLVMVILALATTGVYLHKKDQL